MKQQLFFASLFLLAFSCAEKQSVPTESEEKTKILMMEILKTSGDCLPDSSSCTYAKIVYPSFTDSSTWILNDFIQNNITMIAADFVQDSLPESIESLAESFVNDFERFRNDFPEYNFGWYLNISSEIILDDSAYVSLRIDTESYTGGAHPNNVLRYYVVRKTDAQPLGLGDIISDTIQFKSFLEKAFRKDKGLEDSQSFSDAGYFIEDDGFLLTDNIGLTEDEVLVHFNPYEIAPYSLGPTTITLNRRELGALMKIK